MPEEKPIEYISENIRELGYDPDKFYSGTMKFSEIIHPEDKNIVKAQMAKLLSTGACESFHLEYRIVKKDGSIVPVKEFIDVARTANGDVFYQQSLLLIRPDYEDLVCM